MTSGEIRQADAIAFMRDPASHGGTPVEHIETHISHLFLVGELAFKMKKAVTFDFVDFGTLAKRRAACEAELVVNARTARALYIDTVAVNAADGRMWLGAPVAPVEFLVRMHRFRQQDLLDRMAARHELDLQTVREFADAVADLHLSSARMRPDAMPERFRATLEQLIGTLADVLPAAMRARFDRWTGPVVERARRLDRRLGARARRGAVRHGHGDLHLRNACRFRGEVILFDAIEFNPKFSHVDILYDAAFAMMDLRHRGEDAAAVAFLGRYLSATRDYRELEALRVFMSTRAAVRALVGALSADGTGTADYLDLAASLLEPPRPPRLVAIGGRSGTGKSTLAQILAPSLGTVPDVVVLRSDEIRKRMLGHRPDVALAAGAYGADASRAVYRRLRRDAARALRAGARVIVEATFLEAAERSAIAGIAHAERVGFDGLWLSASDEVLGRRLSQRGTDASDADTAVMLSQPALEAVEGWSTVRTDGGLAATVQRAAALLGLPPRV